MSQNRPLIGISCRHDMSHMHPGRPIEAQNRAYVQAVIRAGGIPLLIPVDVIGPMLQTVFEQMDALLFCGGSDIDPAFYRETPLVDKLSALQQERDEHELALIRLAMTEGKPFFAICRGAQIMNVAAGGTLWQDLGSQCPHTMRHDYFHSETHLPRNYIAHEVQLDKNSVLGRILAAERLPVNSLHHQAAKDIPSPLRATGYAGDGVVEALEMTGHPFGLGVQWHPEELVAEHESARRIFAAFIDAARQGR